MATPGQVAEAFRSVLLSNNYRQSRAHEAFDTAAPGGLHKQFYLEGPRLSETSYPSKHNVHNHWEMVVWVAFVPRRAASDPDSGRFEILDELDALIEAWAENATIRADEFSVTAVEPRYDAEDEFWVLEVRLGYTNTRTFT